MSKSTTISSAVITNSTETDIVSAFAILHDAVLKGIIQVEKKATFDVDFTKCGREDYKYLADMARELLAAKAKDRWEQAIAAKRQGVLGVVNTYMSAAQTAKEQFDALPDNVRQFMSFPSNVTIPFSALSQFWGEGTTNADMIKDLKSLSYTVAEKEKDSYVIKVPYIAIGGESKAA